MDYADRHSDFDRFPEAVQTLLRGIAFNRQLWDANDPDPNPVTEALKYHSRPVQRPDRRPYDGDDEYIEEVLHDILDFPTLIPFQEQCWTRLNEMRHARSEEGETQAAMLAAPTGFGKTEGFSGPIFHDLALNDGDGFRKVAIVYPRNALLEDQLERFLVTLHNINENYDADISIGIYNGDVPRVNNGIYYSDLVSEGEFTLAQWTGGDEDESVPIEFEPEWDDETYTLSVPNGPTFDEDTIKLSRDSMRPEEGGTVPDILLTTINSLENFAIKPNYHIIDEFRSIVFDEVHLYNGIYGSHASQIITNTKEAINERVDDDVGMLFIGSSATIDQPEQFGRDLFGVDSGHISVIQTGPEDKRETEDTEHFHFVTSSEEVGTSSTFIQQILLFSHALLEERGDRERKKALTFIDSKSQVNQRYFQIEDFENEDRWQHHHVPPDDWDRVASETPYRTSRPDDTRPGHHLIQDDLNTEPTSADLRLRADEFGTTDLILSTSLLEVGIDIPAIKVISQYRAPWEMSQFVQRIGRASREEGNDAHFLVILENEGGDRTLFHRADRFLEPEITTPLNVDNEILIWIHENLYRAFEIVYRIRNPPRPPNNTQRDQFLETFLDESDEPFFQTFYQFIQHPDEILEELLQQRVRGIDELETTGGLRGAFRELEEAQDRAVFADVAEFVGDPATRFTLQVEDRDGMDEQVERRLYSLQEDTVELLEEAEAGNADTEESVEELLESIGQIDEILDDEEIERRERYDELDELLYDIQEDLVELEPDLEEIPDSFPYNLGYEQGVEAIQTVRGIRGDEEIRQRHQRWRQAYYGKKSIQELFCFIGQEFDNGVVYGHLMVRTVKALLRAVYFFDRAITLGEVREDLEPPHYVPTSYFSEAGETFSIVPEDQHDEGDEEDRAVTLYNRRFGDYDDDEDDEEDDTQRTEVPLTKLFFEYAPYMAKYLADQSLQMFNPPVEEAPPGDEADYYFDVAGLSTEPGQQVITPNTLPVKRVRDHSGNRAQSIVRYCTRSLYVARDFWDTGPHGTGTMDYGQLHSDPVIATEFDAEGPTEERISVTYMSPNVSLDAVELTITPAQPMDDPTTGDSTPFNTDRDNQREELIAFEQPLGFSLQTRGAVWNLEGFVDDFLAEDEYAEYRDRFETHNPDGDLVEAIHYTAAHFLVEVIADVSGVNQAQLLYGVSPENREIAVFEHAEGGQGIVDLFDDVRNRTNHEKLLRSINRVASNPQLINGYLWTDQEFIEAVRDNEVDEVRRFIENRVTVPTDRVVGDVHDMVENTVDRVEEFAEIEGVDINDACEIRHEVVRRQFVEGIHEPSEDLVRELDIDATEEEVRNLMAEPDVDGCLENLHQAYSIVPGEQSDFLSQAVMEPLYEHVILRTEDENWGDEMLDNRAIPGAQIDGENIFHSL